MLMEPSGAVSFAALLHGKVDATGKKAVAVISGGNIDKETLVSLL
jgi:threonine dehydratase